MLGKTPLFINQVFIQMQDRPKHVMQAKIRAAVTTGDCILSCFPVLYYNA